MTRHRLASLAFLSTLAAVVAAAGPQTEPTARPVKPVPQIPIGRIRVRPSGPPNRSREEARRRKQMARAGQKVVEPVPVDLAACAAPEEGGGA